MARMILKFKNRLNYLWKIWAKALGQKADDDNRVSDHVAIIRSIIIFLYMLTNAFIIAGVIRHWNN